MTLRLATRADVGAINALIAQAGIALSRGFYDATQAAAITRDVFGVDTQLIDDGTYFVIEDRDVLVAAGGWSRRGSLFGGDDAKKTHGGTEGRPDPLLDPATDAARIRAFFVSPGLARRGLGSRLMRHAAAEAWAAGFRRLTLVATLPGEPLYRRFGFAADARLNVTLSDGVRVPLVDMSRRLDGPSLDP